MIGKSADFTILDNAAIKALDPGFAGKNNSITYLNNVALIKVVKKWLALIGMTFAIEDREAAYRVHTVLNEVINPLLDGAEHVREKLHPQLFHAGNGDHRLDNQEETMVPLQ